MEDVLHPNLSPVPCLPPHPPPPSTPPRTPHYDLDFKVVVLFFYVPGREAGTYYFYPVCLWVCWLDNLTLVITFEPFEIEPLYLACRFLVTRASHSYKKKFTSDLDLDK